MLLVIINKYRVFSPKYAQEENLLSEIWTLFYPTTDIRISVNFFSIFDFSHQDLSSDTGHGVSGTSFRDWQKKWSIASRLFRWNWNCATLNSWRSFEGPVTVYPWNRRSAEPFGSALKWRRRCWLWLKKGNKKRRWAKLARSVVRLNINVRLITVFRIYSSL